MKKLKMTEGSIDWLKDNKIYLAFPIAGFEVQFKRGTLVEPYVKYGSGGHDRKVLIKLGAFSYITSNPSDSRVSVGRYSSISWGLKFTLERGAHYFKKDSLLEFTQNISLG
jgi:hypothetical protein